MNYFLGRIGLVSAIALFAFSSFPASAAEYSLYVDASASDEGDGTKDEPFRKLSDAIGEAKSGDRIYVANGEYPGGFTVPESVSLRGENRDKTVIKGTVTATNKTSFSDLTISGGSVALSIVKDAKVKVEQSAIRDASKIGIEIVPGNGEIVIRKSKIYKNGKGAYIQKGNNLDITGSAVYKNSEEGLDIRNDIDGVIAGNEIYENGEPGIEIILGESDMLIEKNVISGNAASGISAQFYPDFKKTGDTVIRGNTIKKNGSYGITCKTPSGGKPSAAYWEKSLTIEKNVFSGNKDREIAGRCNIPLAADVEAVTKEQVVAIDPEAAQKKAEEEAAKIAAAEEARRVIEADAKIREEAEAVIAEFDSMKEHVSEAFRTVDERAPSKYWYWLLGPDEESVLAAETHVFAAKAGFERLRDISVQSPVTETRLELEGKLPDLESYVTEQERNLSAKKRDLGFWNRIKNIFS
jgi:hypothetical protein